MKFVILAATIGHVFGAATGAACKAAVTETVTTTIGQTTPFKGYCDADTNTDGSNDGGATTTCDNSGNGNAGGGGTCGGTAVDGDTDAGQAGRACRTVVVENDPLVDTDSENETAAAVACEGTDTCEGEVLASAGTAQDGVCTLVAGSDGGNCLAAVTAQTACDDGLTVNDAGTASDAADDFCAGTETALGSAAAGADGGPPRTVIDAVAGNDRCTGDLVATIVPETGTETGCTCGAATTAAAAGADGGDCLPVIEASAEVAAVTACGTGLECGSADSDGNTWCVTTGATAEAIDANAAAGAVGGACTAAKVDAVEAQAACTGTLVCTGAVTADSTATPPVEAAAGTCGAATDDSPAAIFYGMSMVTAAIAYLL